METPNYSNGKCETVLDVLSHKFIYNTLIKLYNEDNTERISHQNNISDKINISQIEGFIIKVFKDEQLLRRFFERLREKYSRLADWIFSEEQIFVTLTTLHYIVHELSIKPFTKTIESINIQINDILQFDYEWWKFSRQKMFNTLMDKKISLLDYDWYEVIDFVPRDQMLDKVDIIFHKGESAKNIPFYAIMTESEESLNWNEIDNYYIKLSNWKELKDSSWFSVSLSELRKAVVTNNHIYFQTYDFEYFFDETWNILKDSFWNYIDEILWLELLWDIEIILVTSNGFDSNYYININTKEVLFAKKDGKPQWVINKILVKEIIYMGVIYYQAEFDNEVVLIDIEWNILLWDDREPAFNVIWEALISRKAAGIK